jgi:hypothetical protein
MDLHNRLDNSRINNRNPSTDDVLEDITRSPDASGGQSVIEINNTISVSGVYMDFKESGLCSSDTLGINRLSIQAITTLLALFSLVDSTLLMFVDSSLLIFADSTVLMFIGSTLVMFIGSTLLIFIDSTLLMFVDSTLLLFVDFDSD